MEKEIITDQLIDQIAELQARRAEIDLEIEDIIFQMKCIFSDEEDKIHINT